MRSPGNEVSVEKCWPVLAILEHSKDDVTRLPIWALNRFFGNNFFTQGVSWEATGERAVLAVGVKSPVISVVSE